MLASPASTRIVQKGAKIDTTATESEGGRKSGVGGAAAGASFWYERAVRGAYILGHPKREGRAELVVEGTHVRFSLPGQPPEERVLASEAKATAALNAKLVELTAEGWEIADIETESARRDEESAREQEEIEKTPPGPEERLADIAIRNAQLLSLDASGVEVSTEQAMAILVEAAKDPPRGLCIYGAQQETAPWYTSVAPWCEALGRAGPESLERLVVDTYFESLTRQASTRCGDITPIFERQPNLVFAYIVGCADLSRLRHDRLEELALMADPMTPETIRAAVTAGCPRLRSLALGLSYERGTSPDADAALLEAFGSATLPALEELTVSYPADPLRVLLGLLEAGVVGRLRTLVIDAYDFDDPDEAAARLRERADAFAALEGLLLPTEGWMDGQLEELREVIPGLGDADDAKAFDPDRYDWKAFMNRE